MGFPHKNGPQTKWEVPPKGGICYSGIGAANPVFLRFAKKIISNLADYQETPEAKECFYLLYFPVLLG